MNPSENETKAMNENREESGLRRSERKKVPSLWYIEHVNEYKKTAGKKNSELEDRSHDSSELSSPIQTQYMPFVAAPQVYLDMMQTSQGPEIRSGHVAFVLRPNHRKIRECNRNKNGSLKISIAKPGISKKKPQRKFHQTFSSANRLKFGKGDKKSIMGISGHKKPESTNNNNILDMILSAAMKVKKDPVSSESHPHNKVDDLKPRPSMQSSSKSTLDGGYIIKSVKKNNSLLLEHSTRGPLEFSFDERREAVNKMDYAKLFKTRLMENCFGVEKEGLSFNELEKGKLEALVKEKLNELKESFKEMKKGSLLFT